MNPVPRTAPQVDSPLVIAAAPIGEVLVEQFAFMVVHTKGGLCGCSMCDRYRLIRGLLMEIFS